MDYDTFLQQKRITAPATGIPVEPACLNPALFPFQRDIVTWALAKGCAALFCDCGMGKSLMELEWSQHVVEYTGGDALILTPLAVAHQFVKEGAKFGYTVTLCRAQADVRPGINVTNYEMLRHFDPAAFAGVVLDESGILKNYMGKTKQELLTAFARTPYRLAGTAVPAPNDHLELGNHADFLGIMPANEMLMRWFINDTMSAGNYRLKHHAEKDFWRWVSSWAVSLSHPSDLGYEDERFTLPELSIQTHIVEVDHSQATDALFRNAVLSATTMHKEMRLTAADRAQKVAEIVREKGGAWILWCNTNYEADALAEYLPEAVDVRGSESIAAKERKLNAFSDGTIEVLISKPSLCGFGLNWQHCRQMAFVGLSYSYEQLYQALRRSWRFGQRHPVEAHIVMAESEGDVLRAIERKRTDHEEMKRAMNAAMKETQLENLGRVTIKTEQEEETVTGQDWTLHLGDACRLLPKLQTGSVGLSVFSPPFANLYIYSDHEADMGNCKDEEEFFAHFGFLIPELLRVTMPGRLCAVHCKDLPLYKSRDGAAGLFDFPGKIVQAFEAGGWTFHSRVTIWKDPVIEMQRTKSHGLLYKHFRECSEVVRQGMADYLLVFRKWDGIEEGTVSPEPVKHKDTERLDYFGAEEPEFHRAYAERGPHYDRNLQIWQRYASPVWFDVQQTNVLNYQLAREGADERHICPLQLDVIERAVALWSNPGDLVLDPFAGIGSSGYVAVRRYRRFIGTELKPSYFQIAANNLHAAQVEASQRDLFSEVEA